MECIICAYPIDKQERLLSLTACNHQESICSVCFLRVRSLQRKFHCPTCKQELDHVICTKDHNKKFQDFPVWGDSIGEDYVHDSRSQMFFPRDYHQQYVSKLWLYQCKVCNITRRDFKSLRGHYIGEHNLHMCLLCGEQKQVFPSEQITYTQQEYEKHLRHGDNDGSNGHPNCEFCRTRFYDSTALFMHLTREHYSCHLCDSMGIRFKYYQNYNDLEVHFRKDHFICEELVCLDKKFVAFVNEIDLIAHRMQYHPHLTNNRCIPIQFKFKNGDSQKQNKDNNNTANNGNNNDLDNIARTARYEGGLGGRAANGEWQVEIEQTTMDPRDPNRNLLREDMAVLQSLQASTVPAEEFPELVSSNASGASVSNKWMTLKEDSRKSKNNFPTLPSKPVKPVSVAVAKMMKPTSNSNSTKAPAGKTAAAAVAAPALDFEEDFMAISGSGSRPVTVVDSLGSWANVKVDKRVKKKNNNNVNNNANNAAAAATEIDAKPASAPETNSNNSNNTKAPASTVSTSKSTEKSAKSLKELSNNDDFSFDMQRALQASLEDTANPELGDSTKVSSKSANTSAKVTTSSSSAKIVKPAAKKPVAVSSDLADVMKAAGMSVNKKKKPTISVVKASNDSASSKLTVSRSSDNLAAWRSATNSPTPPPVPTTASATSGKVTPPPPPSTIPAKEEDFSLRNHAGWVTLGGAGDKNAKKNVNNAPVRESSDFPSLGGSAKR